MIDYAELDPGVRELVHWLNANGYETCDSGDGQHKATIGYEPGDYEDRPHVYLVAPVAAIAEMIVDELHEALSPYDEAKKIGANYEPGGPWIVSLHGFTNEDVP